MQMWSAYVVELTFLSIPSVLLQLINNTQLKTWNASTIIFICILIANILFGVKGIITTSDKMQTEKTDNQLKIKIRKHHKER